METIFGLVGFGLIVLALVVVVRKGVSAVQGLASQMRGEPTPSPSRSANGVRQGIVSYRTRNGRADYRFRIELAHDGSYRVYILDHRDYGSRDSSQHATHRLRDHQGDYVCWTQRLDTAEQARRVAAIWADKTEDYVIHGRPF